MSLRSAIGMLFLSISVPVVIFSQTSSPLTILHVNDMHARVTPHMYEVPSMDATGKFERVGGAAYLASKMKNLKAQYPNSLVLDGGDITEGNPLGDLRGDGAMVDFLNLLDSELKALGGRGIDASVIGNHDYRDTNYLNSIKRAKYPVLSINLRYKSNNSPVFKPYVIDTVNGQIIGIIGYTKDDEPPTGTNADPVVKLLKCQWSGVAAGGINIRDTVSMLRNVKHCSMVILLAHDAESRLCENSNALIADDGVVKQPEVAITGHWHTMTSTAWRPKKLHDKTITDEAASYMQFIGQLDVDSTGKYVNDHKYAVRCDSITPDSAALAMVDSLVREYNAQGHAHGIFDTIGYSAVDLRCDKGKWWAVDEYPWYGDETAGEWICDGLQWKINQMNLGFNCDLAVQAGGGIRKDVPKGPITYMDIYEVYPWNDDSVAVVKMSGQDIFNYIQNGSLDVDLSQGWHVTGVDGLITSLTRNGQPVSMTDSFYVGISNYMWDNAAAGTMGRLVYRSSTQLIRDGIIEYTAQFNASHPMQVPGPRYDINNRFAGEFDAVVTMVADTESQPQYDNGFLRLIRATPATLARRGSMYVPTSLVNADGSINRSHQMCESMWYRSQLGIPTGLFHPGDIVRIKLEGGFYAGEPEYIEESGIFSPDSDFQIIGHDTSLIHPAYMPDINSFWNEQNINHYVMFYATKTGNNSVRDSKGQVITLYQPGGYNAVTSLPGNLGDMLEIRGVQTTKNATRLFRVGSVRLASDAGVISWPPSSSVQPLAPDQNDSTITLHAIATDPQASTQSVQLIAAADAYVVSGKPTTNYGTGTGIYCQWQDSGSYLIEQPYMRFLLNSLPQNIAIQNAKLRMYAWGAKQTMPVGCFALAKDTAWAESGIKWNNKPALDSLHRLDSLTTSGISQYYEWNVTNYVKQKYAGNDSVNLSVKSLALNRYAYCNFESKEYSNGGYGPFLQVDYTAGKDNSGIAKVDFFFRYSSDSQNWGPWTPAGTVSSAPYDLKFSFANGKGYYQFYSIATDLDGNVEPSPIDADASCHYWYLIKPVPTLAATVDVDSISGSGKSSATVNLSLKSNEWAGKQAEWWVISKGADGKQLYFRNGSWSSNPGATVYPIKDLQQYQIRFEDPVIMNDYKVVFVLDTVMDGQLEYCGVTDSVSFHVSSNCVPRLSINGISGDITVAEHAPVKLELHLAANNWNTIHCDWWVYGDAPSGRLYYSANSGWKSGERVAYQGTAVNMPSYTLLDLPAGLTAGEYTFHLLLDNNMNGILDGMQVETTLKLTIIK